NSGDNLLDGMNGNDTILGGDGDDTLLGGGGLDSLVGGDGSDTYQVSSTEDILVELARDGDQDVVESKVDYALGANIEVLVLLDTARAGTGNELANIIDGNDQPNLLLGGGGDDLLRGLGGDDELEGGAGDDELQGGEGKDMVTYSGEYNAYKIIYDKDSDTWTVQDVRTDDGLDEGIDIISGVELLGFADRDYPLVGLTG
ncbi:MAG: hypothetical protein ACR2HF_09630, partial [Methylococcaceae bacterium]